MRWLWRKLTRHDSNVKQNKRKLLESSATSSDYGFVILNAVPNTPDIRRTCRWTNQNEEEGTSGDVIDICSQAVDDIPLVGAMKTVY